MYQHRHAAFVAIVALLVSCSPPADVPVGGDAPDTTKVDVTDTDAGPDAADAGVDGGGDAATHPDVAADVAPADVPPVDPCPDLCKAFVGCKMDLWADECAELCADDPKGAHKDCLSNNTQCLQAAQCLGLHPKVIRPFDGGPSGLLPRRLAGAFTVTTQGGEFVFEDRWTGHESFMFVRLFAQDKDSEGLWASSLGQLLAASPKTVHYFFAATREPDGSDKVAGHVATMSKGISAALATLSSADRRFWRKHLHVVVGPAPKPGDNKPITAMKGWLADVLAKRGVHAIAIDRFQHVRDVGLLRDPADDDAAWELRWLVNEVDHYDFEDKRHEQLAADGAIVVAVLEAAKTQSVIEGYAKLPALADMAKIDTLELDVALNCLQNLDSNCGESSLDSRLLLCDLPSAATPDHAKTDCKIELARWMTPLGREGRWVTDISPMLAHLQAGGERRLRWEGTKQAKKCFPNKVCIDTWYVPSVHLRLRDAGKGMRPVQMVPAFEGGAFGSSYNVKYEPLAFDVPKDVKKVSLYALITGHGSDLNAEGCSAFCNHGHHFAIGNKTFVRDHPSAAKQDACLKRVQDGVVPNQFGTWPTGRAGWCPGFAVESWLQEVTAEVTVGASNSMTYKGLFEGKTYTPNPLPGKSSADGGTIQMRSYIVLYK